VSIVAETRVPFAFALFMFRSQKQEASMSEWSEWIKAYCDFIIMHECWDVVGLTRATHTCSLSTPWAKQQKCWRKVRTCMQNLPRPWQILIPGPGQSPGQKSCPGPITTVRLWQLQVHLWTFILETLFVHHLQRYS